MTKLHDDLEKLNIRYSDIFDLAILDSDIIIPLGISPVYMTPQGRLKGRCDPCERRAQK